MKKSSWITLTRPKFVYLNIRSMIHIRLGKTSGLVLNEVIINGTSAVLWWLAIINVLASRLRHGVISSPSSITKNVKTLNIIDTIFLCVLNSQTSISRCVRPHGHHRQQPMEEQSLNPVVQLLIVSLHGLQQCHPHQICWQTVDVVQDDQRCSEYRLWVHD